MKLIKEGYGDLTMKDVNGLEGRYVKSIICVNNSILKSLIEDPKFEGLFILADECDLNTFNEVYKFYGGGKMIICDENVVKILKFSISYDDRNIKEYCSCYANDYANEKIICELLQIEDLINQENDLKILNEKMNEYLTKKGYLLLENEECLLKMTVENLERILKNEKLVVKKNESWLLNKLLRWYKYYLDNCKEEKDKIELKEEFKELLRKSIKNDKILIGLIDEDLKEVYSEIKKYLQSNNEIIHFYINEKLSNEKLMEILFDFMIYDEKDSINVEEIDELNKKSLESDLISFLKSNEDMKLIEIVLNIIVDLKMTEIIPLEMKNKLLRKLLCEYGETERSRTLKCLCLFVDSEKNIIIIEGLCGKEILYKILNNEYYLNNKSKELLIKYILEMKLNDDEIEEMKKIINNEELLKELLFKEITSFSYPQSEYSFPIYEEISIIPSFDGYKCKFSINPSLPDGLILDKENGLIHGSVDNEIKKCEYEIICKNIKNEKKFKISLEFVEIKFTELNKSNGISISNNGKLITITSNIWSHCYLNLKIENGIYHIKYKYHQNGSSGNDIMLGLSTDNTYSGDDIFYQSTTCSYYASSGNSNDSICHIGTIVNKNPNFNNHGDGSIYEIIVDMNKREFSICHNNSSPVVLVKDLPSPLYPYAELHCKNTSIELLQISKQN